MNNPKGILVAIGGREDKGNDLNEDGSMEGSPPFFVSGILKEITSLLRNKKSRIEVFTTASGNPDKMRITYQESFKKLGYTNVGFVYMKDRSDAESTETIERIRQAEGIFFTGGSQNRLLHNNQDTPFLKELEKLYYSKEIVIAGTSAGAMVMSALMIDSKISSEHLERNAFSVIPGFSFIKNVIIDTHFANRGRFWRLAEAVAQHPECIGIGMDEDTAVMMKKGNELEVIGSGLVILIEGRHITLYESPRKGSGDNLTIENLISHILSRGDRFLINNKAINKTDRSRSEKQKYQRRVRLMH